MKNILFATFSLILITSCNSSNKNKMSEAELDAKAQAKVDQMLEEMKQEEMTDEFQWKYSQSEDEMTSELNQFAQVTSEDLVNLDFPYAGGTYMTLHIRKKGNSTDAFVKVTTGQLHTDYNNPVLTLRFDENEPEIFRVTDEASGDSEYLFFTNPNALIERLRSAKKTKVKCMFYDQGSYVFNFNTENFTW